MKEGRVLWLLLLAIMLAGCCGAVTVAGILLARGIAWGDNLAVLGRVQAAATIERSFPAQQARTLALDVPLGDISIQAGTAERVTVQASLRAWDRTQAAAQAQLDQLNFRAEQEGQQVRITIDNPRALGENSGAPRAPEITLRITAPPQTALQAETEVGRLTVTGLRGDITVTAGVGAVLLEDVLPESRMAIWSQVGNIELRGPLTIGATYDLASDVGRIALRVPADSAFTIAARSDLGSVDLGFPLQGSSEQVLMGKEVRGEVGVAPTTTLTLRSRVGAISVQPLP